MYLWDIHVRRHRTITSIKLSCVFTMLYISSPFDDKIFTEDYNIPTERGGEKYSIRFNVSENNISEFIKSQLYNKVVGEVTDLTSEIEHMCDMTDIYTFPSWKFYGNITCLQKLNDLMCNTLLV